MSRLGNSLDDGLIEGFFGILKREMFYGQEHKYKDLNELEKIHRLLQQRKNQDRTKKQRISQSGTPSTTDKPEGHIGVSGDPITSDKPEFPIGISGDPITTDKPKFHIGVSGNPITTGKPEFKIPEEPLKCQILLTQMSLMKLFHQNPN